MVLVHSTSPQYGLSVYVFEVTSFNTFEVMPRIRFHDAQTDGQTG